MDEIPSISSENAKQTENNIDSQNQDSSTSEIDIDDIDEPNVEDDEDNVSELNFSLPHMDEPMEQEIDRGLQVEQKHEHDDKNPEAMKSGDSNQKSKSNKSSEVLKTYPKRTSRNKPPKYYGWSSHNPLNWM